jgi:hypothetical protein
MKFRSFMNVGERLKKKRGAVPLLLSNLYNFAREDVHLVALIGKGLYGGEVVKSGILFAESLDVLAGGCGIQTVNGQPFAVDMGNNGRIGFEVDATGEDLNLSLCVGHKL